MEVSIALFLFTTLTLVSCLNPFAPKSQTLKPCKANSTCSCTNVDGYYDLHPLANNDNTPYFQNVSSGKYLFSYNPCYGFDEGNVCENAAVCQLDTSTNKYYVLGYANTIQVISDSQYGLLFQYIATTDEPRPGIQRTANVILVCDPTSEGSFQFLTESPKLNYHFKLFSKYACPIAVNPKSETQTTPLVPPTRNWSTPPALPTPAAPTSAPTPFIFSLKAVVVLLLCNLFVLTFLCGLVILGICVFTVRSKSPDNEKVEQGESVNSDTDDMKIHLKNDF